MKKEGTLSNGSTVKKPPTVLTWVQSLGQEDSLEESMAIYSSILAWKIPWTGVWQATVYRDRVRHD